MRKTQIIRKLSIILSSLFSSLFLPSCSNNAEEVAVKDDLSIYGHGSALKVSAPKSNRNYVLFKVYFEQCNEFFTKWDNDYYGVKVPNGEYRITRTIYDDVGEKLDFYSRYAEGFDKGKNQIPCWGKIENGSTIYFDDWNDYYVDCVDFTLMKPHHGKIQYRLEYYDKDKGVAITNSSEESDSVKLDRECNLFFDIYDDYEVRLYEASN